MAPRSDGALGPDAAAVAFDDPLDAGQADAGTGELGGRVQPLEWLEQLARIGGVEAGPVVAHVAADLGVIGGRGAELDGGRVAPGGELPGVFDQVLQHGADETAIRGHPDAVLDGEADPAAGFTGLQFAGDGGDLRAEIDRSEVHARLRDTRDSCSRSSMSAAIRSLAAWMRPAYPRPVSSRRSPYSSSSASLNPFSARSGARRSWETE